MSLQSTANGQYLRRAVGFASSQPTTIILWFRFNALSTALQSVWDLGDSTNFTPQVYYGYPENILYLAANFVGTDPDKYVFIDLAPTAGVWYWVAAVFNGTGNVVTAYWNKGGSGPIQTGSTTGNFGGFTGTSLTFCNELDNDQALNGQITGVKIWSAALNATEIAAEYAQLAPVRTANIYSYPETAVATGAGTDLSGQGNNFTAVGALTTSTEEPPIAGGGVGVPAVALSYVTA